jgi:predicted dinucleotide-binding enzyme
MHVAVIGTGPVGEHLTAALTAAGHDVTVGSRDPEGERARAVADRTDALVELTAGAVVGVDAVVLAVPGSVAPAVAADVAAELGDTPLLDATNRFPAGERPVLADVADAVAAPVAKAFNTIGAEHLRDPSFGDRPASMFLAGDPVAVDVAETLSADLGFDPVRCGGVDAANHLESLARFWVHLAGDHGRDVGFALLRQA